VAAWIAPAGTVEPVRTAAVSVLPIGASDAPATAIHVAVAAVSHGHLRRSANWAARPPLTRRVGVAEAVAAGPHAPGDVPVVALVLAAAAALIALVAIWTQVRAKAER